jgi:hypothetical protein
MVRAMNCDDCKLNMNEVKRHLTEDKDVEGKKNAKQ